MPEHLQACALHHVLLSSAQEVFSSMLGVEVRPGASAFDPDSPFDGVLSVIGLTGAWAGSGFLRCSDRTACDIASRFLMTASEYVNGEVLDAMGELINMIVGLAKTVAEEQQGPIQISIPTVVYGKNISIRNMKSELRVPLWCTYEGGDIMLGICLAKSSVPRQVAIPG